MSLTIYW